MDIPESLAHRIRIFRETGHIFRNASELFDDSWQQVMIGQGLTPERYHSLLDTMSEREITDFLRHIKSNVDRTVAGLPDHTSYLASFLSASR